MVKILNYENYVNLKNKLQEYIKRNKLTKRTEVSRLQRFNIFTDSDDIKQFKTSAKKDLVLDTLIISHYGRIMCENKARDLEYISSGKDLLEFMRRNNEKTIRQGKIQRGVIINPAPTRNEVDNDSDAHI